MILVITKENEKLISEVCNSNDIEDYQIITTVTNLYNFTVTELKSLNNFTQIIIDITVITDNEKQLIDSIVTLKTIYQDLRIIILAIGYGEGNTTLSRLFSESIFNFVTSKEYQTQKEELTRCVTTGNSYSDSVKFRYREDSKDIPKSKVLIKKEYTKRNQCVTIGVVGTQPHIGTTTQCFLICKFLNSLGISACYVQTNNKADVEKLTVASGIKELKDMITYNEIDIFRESVDTNRSGYDFYIYDYGDIENFNQDSFEKNDIKIIVSGTKEWEFVNLVTAIQKLDKFKNSLDFILSFTSKEQEHIIIDALKEYKNKIYFSEYTPNPFEIKNENIYHRILKEFIIEKTNQIEIIDKKKFNIKNIFAKKEKI